MSVVNPLTGDEMSSHSHIQTHSRRHNVSLILFVCDRHMGTYSHLTRSSSHFFVTQPSEHVACLSHICSKQVHARSILNVIDVHLHARKFPRDVMVCRPTNKVSKGKRHHSTVPDWAHSTTHSHQSSHTHLYHIAKNLGLIIRYCISQPNACQF